MSVVERTASEHQTPKIQTLESRESYLGLRLRLSIDLIIDRIYQNSETSKKDNGGTPALAKSSIRLVQLLQGNHVYRFIWSSSLRPWRAPLGCHCLVWVPHGPGRAQPETSARRPSERISSQLFPLWIRRGLVHGLLPQHDADQGKYLALHCIALEAHGQLFHNSLQVILITTPTERRTLVSGFWREEHGFLLWETHGLLSLTKVSRSARRRPVPPPTLMVFAPRSSSYRPWPWA